MSDMNTGSISRKCTVCVCVYSMWIVFAILLKDKSQLRMILLYSSSSAAAALYHFYSGFTMVLFPSLAAFSYLRECKCVVSAYFRRTQSE